MTTEDGEKAEGEPDLGRRRRRLGTRRGAGSEGEDDRGHDRDLARDGRPEAAREEGREIPP